MSATERFKGGVARAERLTPEERSEIAKKAANARWSGDVPRAICGSPDHPLRIGDGEDAIEIPCYVLENGKRVLYQRALVDALGMSRGSAGGTGGDRLAKFVSGNAIKPFMDNTLQLVTEPIRFRTPGGTLAYGYDATVLADICEAVLKARDQGLLQKQQEHIAVRCEILVRGFARVGIIALVDEATGYQEFRARDALARILEAFVAKELQPWIQTFGSDFYHEMFRLRGLDYPRDSVRRPQYFGHLTNDLVYKRLAPGVLDELRRVTPVLDSGRRKYKYFQRLTQNVGYPKLKEHLGAVVAIMQLSKNWNDFMSKIDRLRPRVGETMMLPFPDDEDDNGRGL
jgi:hypothetical protein